MERRYYEAYDDRYRQIHTQQLRWFSEEPSPIVWQILSAFSVPKSAAILEIGCGEGRDAKALLHAGYHLLATDISPAAISFCRAEDPFFSEQYRVLDCLSESLAEKFDFIYAVSVLHMLVKDVDRDGFYRFIEKHLSQSGIALICTMGDGSIERQSDISTAFDLQERIHEKTGKTVQVAGTSCRVVSFVSLHRELRENGFRILQEGMTSIEPDFPCMMYAVVTKENKIRA